MESLQWPWSFSLKTDLETGASCLVVVVLTLSFVAYTLALNARRAARAEAFHLKVEHLPGGHRKDQQTLNVPLLSDQHPANAASDPKKQRDIYFVMWHDGQVMGKVFEDHQAAEALYDKKRAGQLAVMLTNDRFERMRYYGDESHIAALHAWWQQKQEQKQLMKYYVMCHCGDGDVQGTVFETLEQAALCFEEKNGGPYATMLTDHEFEKLRYYGKGGPGRLGDFRAWWDQQRKVEAGVADAAESSKPKFYKGHLLAKPEFRHWASEIMCTELSFGRTAALHALRAPFSCPKNLNQRLQLMTPLQSCVWLLPAMLIAELLAISMCCFGVQTRLARWSQIDAEVLEAWMLCTPIVIVIAMLLRLASKLSSDREFVNIDNFEEHRKVKGFTSKNVVKLASLIYVFFACASLAASLLRHAPTQNADASQYAKMREKIAHIFGAIGLVHIRLDWLADWVCSCAIFSCSSAVVLAWVIWYHPLIHKVMHISANEMTSAWDVVRRSRDVCVRMHIYEDMAASKHYTTAFLLLSDTLFLPVVTNLLKMLACSHTAEGHANLRGVPDLLCWSTLHTGMAISSVICLFAYVPTVVFGASFILADSDGIFASSTIDLLFESRYLVIQTLMKVMLGVASVFVGPLSAPWSLTMQFVMNVLMTLTTIAMKPCSVLWANYLCATAFACTALFDLMALYDASTNVQWWPFLLFVIGFAVVMGMLAHTARSLRKIGGCPSFSRSPAMGPSFQDTWGFDDMGRLRGQVHRLRQITFWVQRGRVCLIKGLQCVFEIDGVVTFGAPYQVTGQADAGWEIEHLVFEHGEEILEARTCWSPPPKSSLSLLIRTSKQEYRFNWQETAERKVQKFLANPGEVVVGLHGGLGGGLHNIGFISTRRA